jgi:hypothetical protein
LLWVLNYKSSRMAKKLSPTTKTIVYDVFRYQISPKSGKQFEIFGEEISVNELKARKNAYFHQSLLDIRNFISAHGKVLAHKIVLDKDNITALKLGPEKTITLQDREFETKTVETVTDVRIIINNEPNIQKVAISRNRDAFETSFVVANILAENLNKLLDSYGLELSINPILVKEDFWKLIKSYEHKITSLRFEIIKPNISNISGSLGEQFKDLVSGTNSQKTILELKAPEGRVLENINEENKPLMEIADYAAKGGASDIRIRVKNVKKVIRTNSTIEKVQIADIEITGNAADAIAAYNQILNS